MIRISLSGPLGIASARFWAKVDKSGPTQPHMTTPCWVWTGAKDKDGYGKVCFGDRSHRVSWRLSFGEPTADKPFVLHRCDNPPCVRPDHLFIGTARDNNADREAKGRSRYVTGDAHGLRRHPERFTAFLCAERPRGERASCVKLTESQVLEIRTRYLAGGVTQRFLAREFGVSQPQIGHIVRGEHWAHLSQPKEF